MIRDVWYLPLSVLAGTDEQESEELMGDDGHRTNYYDLMQYTGLKDKNGKEIYEGDIVEVSKDISAGKYRVQFWDNESAFMLIDDLKPKSMRLGVWFCSNKIEVIGNIYENPELLTK